MAFNGLAASPDELQQLGQKHYRSKQYKEALTCFSQLLSEGTRDRLGALDNRAATYTKLGNLRAALRDGQCMIKEAKSSCSGYLRTGKILQLLGKDSTALGIYKYGLRNVPPSDLHSDLLKGMHDKLSGCCATLKACDPLTILPPELAHMILTYLNFNHFVSLLRVSRSWYEFLESMPSLWTDLDLSTARKPVIMAAIRAYVKRSEGNVTRVLFHRFAHRQDDVLKYIATRCKFLTHLDIPTGFIGVSLLKAAPYASRLKTLILREGCAVTLDTVTQLLGHFRNIDKAEFHGVAFPYRTVWDGIDMTNIRSLTLNAEEDCKFREISQRGLGLNTLIKLIPNIQNLSLHIWNMETQSIDFSGLLHLQSLDLSRMRMGFFPKLPSSLQTLKLTNCYIGGDHLQTLDTILTSDLINLTRLYIRGLHSIFPPALRALLESNKGNHTELNLHDFNFGVMAVSSTITLSHLPRIVALDLGCCHVTDSIVTELLAKIPYLETLNLESTEVTGVGVKALVLGSSEGKLKKLFLNGCRDVSSDAVEWARGKGVQVDCYFSDPVMKGKKICY